MDPGDAELHDALEIARTSDEKLAIMERILSKATEKARQDEVTIREATEKARQDEVRIRQLQDEVESIAIVGNISRYIFIYKYRYSFS